MDLIALLVVIDLLLQLVKAADLLKLKKASKRLDPEDLLLVLFLVGGGGFELSDLMHQPLVGTNRVDGWVGFGGGGSGGEGKGTTGDSAAASEAGSGARGWGRVAAEETKTLFGGKLWKGNWQEEVSLWARARAEVVRAGIEVISVA